jgi:hypothetical protein
MCQVRHNRRMAQARCCCCSNLSCSSLRRRAAAATTTHESLTATALLSQCVCAIIYGGIHQGSRKHIKARRTRPPLPSVGLLRLQQDFSIFMCDRDEPQGGCRSIPGSPSACVAMVCERRLRKVKTLSLLHVHAICQ